MKAPDKWRLTQHHPLARKLPPSLFTRPADGCNGFFIFPHPKINDYWINCMVSNGLLWDHVSVTLSNKMKQVNRTPTWAEMCWVKEQFWEEDETVMQLHPPKAEHINNHDFCLHLWRPQADKIPTPPAIMVGLPGKTEKDFI